MENEDDEIKEPKEEEFMKAVFIKRNLRTHEKAIKRYWDFLGSIRVQCPHCGQAQESRTVLSKKCFVCHCSFRIVSMTKDKCWKNNAIVFVPREKIPALNNVISLTLEGKFLNII